MSKPKASAGYLAGGKPIIGPRITVRKSIFFGSVFSIDDENDARAIVKEMKKNDRKARHIVFAYRMEGDPAREGMSDDGEPHGTGGFPLLMLLRNRNDTNTLITITRYWGGVKLGPGNLKRAYVEAAKQAMTAVDEGKKM